MQLAIDVREAVKSTKTGKGQWTYGFVSELLRRGIPLTLFSDQPPPREWREARCITLSQGSLWHLRALTKLREGGFNFFVSPTSTIIPAILRGTPTPVPIIHDLIAFRKERHNRKAKIIESLTVRRAVRSAPHIFTVSNTTRDDLLHFEPTLTQSKVTTIFAGPSKEEAPVSSPDERTILCVGTLCPRKNQLRLIQAYASLPPHLRKQYRLVLVGGRGWGDTEILEMVRETPGIEWFQYVNPSAYEELLHHATVFALPSLYEGFGLSLLDALQRGVPVLTSSRGSIPEVTGGHALEVDPENIPSIAAGLRRILEDEGLRTSLRESGRRHATRFSWEKTVDLFLQALP